MSQAKIFYERLLPHWHPPDAFLFITFCLYGSMPLWRRPEATASPGEAFRGTDAHLDAARTGPVWLKDSRVASAVVQVLRSVEIDRRMCEIGGFVVMSNHVHLLMRPIAPAAEVMRFIKGVSARTANQILNRMGLPFWQRESYDHWVRNDTEYRRILRYLEWNPVTAGLVENPELWPWSSASQIHHEQAKACSTTRA
jgi:putative transposase